jgi:Ca2+-dependent lipid-binding protein
MAVTSSSQRIKGILSVTVLEAKNLKKTDWFGENDCYVVISTEPLSMQSKMKATDKKQQTETYQITQIHNVSNPIFNEKFVFLVPEKLDALYAQLWDADYDKDDLLGYEELNLLDDDKGGIGGVEF